MILEGQADEPEPVEETMEELSTVFDRLLKQVENGGLDGFTGERRVRFAQAVGAVPEQDAAGRPCDHHRRHRPRPAR